MTHCPATFLFFAFRWVGDNKGRLPSAHIPHDAPLVHPIYWHGEEACAEVSFRFAFLFGIKYPPIRLSSTVFFLLQIGPRVCRSCCALIFGPDLKRRAAPRSPERKYAISWSNWDIFVLFCALIHIQCSCWISRDPFTKIINACQSLKQVYDSFSPNWWSGLAPPPHIPVYP